MKFLAGGSVVGHENVSGGEEAAAFGPAYGDDVAVPELLEVVWGRRRLPAVSKAGFGCAVVLDQLLDCHGTHARAELAFNEFLSGVGHNGSDASGGSGWIFDGGFAAENRGWVGESMSFSDGDGALKRNMNGVRDDGSSDEQLVELDPEQ